MDPSLISFHHLLEVGKLDLGHVAFPWIQRTADGMCLLEVPQVSYVLSNPWGIIFESMWMVFLDTASRIPNNHCRWLLILPFPLQEDVSLCFSYFRLKQLGREKSRVDQHFGEKVIPH